MAGPSPPTGPLLAFAIATVPIDHAARRRIEEGVIILHSLRQESDGRIPMQGSFHGPAYQTGMLLLSSALDYTLLPIYER